MYIASRGSRGVVVGRKCPRWYEESEFHSSPRFGDFIITVRVRVFVPEAKVTLSRAI